MITTEERFTEVLELLQSMIVEASGRSHGHIDVLLNPTTRSDPKTLNYLIASASGTLQDRIFCQMNNDHVPNNDFKSFNRQYSELLDEAVQLARTLKLPASGCF